MTEKIDLKRYIMKVKKKEPKKTKMVRAQEGDVFCFPRNTADGPNLKITMSQDNTNR